MCFVQIKYVIVHSPPVVYYLSGTTSLIPEEDAFVYLQILSLSFFIMSRFDTFGTLQMLKHNIVNRISRQVSVELPSEAYKFLIWKNPAV